MNYHITRKEFLTTSASSVLIFVALASVSQAANAQTAAADRSPLFGKGDATGETVNQKADGMADIIVTARKKSETLLEVPLAVTAFSAAEISRKNIQSLADVASFTPSLTVSSFGNSTSQRSQQTVVIRGMTPGSSYSNTTTVFLNGAPLGASGLIDGLSDVAQIEIVKGPQSAYFGRSTFGGAVNIITKPPGDTFKASTDLLYGSYNWADVKATLEGPIIPGVLKLRVTGRYYNIDGQYHAVGHPETSYGGQSSRDVLAELEFTPTENLQIRLFGAYMEQDDQTAPIVKFGTPSYNCNAGAKPFVCGVLPQMQPLGPNTELPASFFTALQTPAAGTRYRDIGLNHMGSASQIRIATLNINYNVPDTGLTISAVTAANKTNADSITDLANEYFTGSAQRWPFDTYNYNAAFSQELRVTSNQSKRLRGSVGVNYQWTRTGQTNMGLAPPLGTFAAYAPGNINRNSTIGVFGSASFDVTSQIILNLEGRYQVDTTTGYRRTATAEGDAVETKVPGLKQTTHEFLPRVILQYKFLPKQQLYFTFSKGSNPGLFNSALLTYSQAFRDYLTSITGAGIVVKPEKLTNFELGYKASLFDDRLQFDADIYYDKWRNQLISQVLYINNQALTGIAGVATIGAYSNLGSTNLKGIEANLFYRFSDELTAGLGGAINASHINTYSNSADATLMGIVGTAPLDLYKGNQLPNYSKYSGTVSVDYTRALSAAIDGFVHVDYVHKSGMYNDPANFARTPAANRVNLRLGVNRDRQRFEFFVENLTNDQAYGSITNSIDVSRSYQATVLAVLPMPRRFGFRIHSEF
jgi:iron complex outermembrane receptor protein